MEGLISKEPAASGISCQTRSIPSPRPSAQPAAAPLCPWPSHLSVSLYDVKPEEKQQAAEKALLDRCNRPEPALYGVLLGLDVSSKCSIPCCCCPPCGSVGLLRLLPAVRRGFFTVGSSRNSQHIDSAVGLAAVWRWSQKRHVQTEPFQSRDAVVEQRAGPISCRRFSLARTTVLLSSADGKTGPKTGAHKNQVPPLALPGTGPAILLQSVRGTVGGEFLGIFDISCQPVVKPLNPL